MTNQSGISGIEFMMPPDINKYEHEMGKIEQLIPRGTPGAS